MHTPAARKWTAILADAERVGLPMREFARSRGLNPSTMAWWKWRLKRESGGSLSGFIPVVVTSSPVVELRIGAMTVAVDDDTDLSLLRRVIEALS